MASVSDSKPVVRPTKKQRELLSYIGEFIAQNGYSPSYREIMNGLNYTSVATVALHVNNLIKRGHLRKRDHSARSLELVSSSLPKNNILSNEVKPNEEKWLIEKVEHAFREVENSSDKITQEVDNLYILVEALKVLGLVGAAQSFRPRLQQLKLLVNS
jgi:SOS-response transcriptional repressor LexA